MILIAKENVNMKNHTVSFNNIACNSGEARGQSANTLVRESCLKLDYVILDEGVLYLPTFCAVLLFSFIIVHIGLNLTSK